MVEKSDGLAVLDCLDTGLRVLGNLVMEIKTVVRVELGVQGNIMIAWQD